MEISAQQAAFEAEKAAAIATVKGWTHAKRMRRAVAYVHKYFDFSSDNAQAYDRFTKVISDAATIFFVKQDSLHKHF